MKTSYLAESYCSAIALKNEVSFGDGSVQSVSASISAEAWDRLCDPQHGRVLSSDWN